MAIREMREWLQRNRKQRDLVRVTFQFRTIFHNFFFAAAPSSSLQPEMYVYYANDEDEYKK